MGLGASHIITSHLVLDADFGYTRQVTGAQSTVDLPVGDFGLNTLKIPGTNGTGVNYVGQPVFAFGTIASKGTSNSFSSLGNASGANPFLFRDNQFTGDVNLSWTKGRHATKYGFTYYHFLLNHFQPTSGGAISNPRGDLRWCKLRLLHLRHTGRLPAGSAQPGNRCGCRKGNSTDQPQCSAVVRIRRLRSGPMDGLTPVDT